MVECKGLWQPLSKEEGHIGGEVLDAIAHFQIAWTDDEFVDFQVANVTYSVIPQQGVLAGNR